MLFPKKARWDGEAEIIIIGYGLAGAVAAITAHDLGAGSILLEKQGADSHCSCSSISMGIFLSPSDTRRATEYLIALNQTAQPGMLWTDTETVQAWVEYAAQNRNWLKKLGGKIKFFARGGEFPQLPGADSMESWKYQGNGRCLMQFMYEQVKSRRISVHYETPAQRLLTDESGRVIGVSALDLRGGQAVHFKASRAVILCSGGFEENEEMKLQYLRVHPAYFTGGTANTGDGIRMAQEAGADLWHMNCVSARLVAKFPDFPVAFFIDFSGGGWSQRQMRATKEPAGAGYIIVDRYGRRYLNETLKPHAAYYELTSFDSHRLEYPRVPSYYLCDRRRIEAGPIGQLTSGPSGPEQLYRWSRDNGAELDKGWIVGGDTIDALAGRIGLPSAALESTVRRWNQLCEAGKDADLGRNATELVPLDRPPFYAIALFPGGSNTQGGPKRNRRAQVVGPFGAPIPGLYAAGECGSIFGMLYPAGGGNLAECIAFGRIAAENAAKETPRT